MASKYNNRRMAVGGYIFDSKDEAKYYELLKDKKAQGLIVNFELQPQYELQPSFKRDGKTIRAITYTADFLIYHNDGTEEAVDIKSLGTATQQGLLRRKMFWHKYQGLKLTWLCRNLKHGDENGWIEYDELKKARRKAK